MILTIKGDDISHLTLAILQDTREPFVPPQTILSAPEGYLGIIDAFLSAHDLSLKDVHGIVIEPSNGSATAIRVSHAIANAWGFANGIPLYRSLESVPLSILLPEYEQTAHVTVRKKDALHRRT